MKHRPRIVIIGGGIAGVSLAARLAPDAEVVLLESEPQLGFHATGRSAALLVEAYGPPVIRRLTGASRAFFETPPAGFTEAPLCRRRGGLVYGRADELERLAREYEHTRAFTAAEWLDADALLAACPILRPGLAIGGFVETGALDLDANALLQGFARAARAAAGVIRVDAPVQAIGRQDGCWRVAAGGASHDCDIVVDAAGAWADTVAAMAGAARLGLQPKRRTAATLPVPPDIQALLPSLPFVSPLDESFYFKPEARAIMVSLADETDCDPCDAFPDDLDVATALDRFHAATLVPEARPTATWAGLRTFAPDRDPVIGFDPRMPGFFWYAGQGGYGIQTAPALSALGAQLILGKALSEAERGLAAEMDPGRIGGR